MTESNRSTGVFAGDLSGLSTQLGPEFSPQAVTRLGALDPQGLNGLLPRLFRMYAELMHKQADALERCAHEGRIEGLREAAHAVRSSSLSVGAESFAQACLHLERRINDKRAASRGGPDGSEVNAAVCPDDATLCIDGKALADRARAIRQSVVAVLVAAGLDAA